MIDDGLGLRVARVLVEGLGIDFEKFYSNIIDKPDKTNQFLFKVVGADSK